MRQVCVCHLEAEYHMIEENEIMFLARSYAKSHHTSTCPPFSSQIISKRVDDFGFFRRFKRTGMSGNIILIVFSKYS